VTDIEGQQYGRLFDKKLNELDDVSPKKRPDFIVHIKVSLDKKPESNKKRGRELGTPRSEEEV
ncbi:deoxynucleoside kinase, partial [Enterococcus faecium]